MSAVPPTLPPPTTSPIALPAISPNAAPPASPASTVGDVVETVIENLADNGYQTGVALVVATIAVVAMLNLRVHRLALFPVGLGAFWAGWLGWNTFTSENNPLFPGDIEATKLWDVALASDTGFLLVVGVGCILAVLLWKTGASMLKRVVLITGGVLGASFIYNLVEAVRATA